MMILEDQEQNMRRSSNMSIRLLYRTGFPDLLSFMILDHVKDYILNPSHLRELGQTHDNTHSFPR